ncbi:sugar transferase [Gordonia sp. PDNC005]|uniref:sugar transferase n=1 Tax=unclassified Gordonia (in: high G+C Gram-positive bacteria) TaxID=2657482 RepID=UPI00196529C0|nr:sugar transferase [Gordonia sp. PDNC005]QRY61681.1 sugar transferase [Gordonia sp. PDNC005]
MSVPYDAEIGWGTTRDPVVHRIARSHPWLDILSRRLRFSDFVVVAAAVAAGHLVRFGADADLTAPAGLLGTPMVWREVGLVFGWTVALGLAQARDRRVLCSGATEYNRVISASFCLFGALAIVDLALNLSVARGYLAVVFPLGTLMLLVSRWLWRRRVARGRSRGRYLQAVLVIGDATTAAALARRLLDNAALGYTVVGVCVPSAEAALRIRSDRQLVDAGISVYAGYSDVHSALAETGAAVAAVTDAEVLGHDALHDLMWELDDQGIDLLVAPGLAGVAGPRITVRIEPGLPLLHVDRPRHHAANRIMKVAFDKAVSLCAIVVFAPVMVVCAIAIKLDSRGPVFYLGERIGAKNVPFYMWKFRTMVDGADRMVADLAQHDDGNGVLFKIHDDPRVTRVGRFLRRHSLDELPQLFNVMSGTMSLVGPRPPLRDEVQTYNRMVVRRQLVRPGITGLWQVSGRSDLSWEESAQLDLSYVENWSLTGDLIILRRTAHAVLSKDGAY